jgi:cytochrome P450
MQSSSEVLKCPVEHIRTPEQFNPFLPQFDLDPHSAFKAARQEQPVFFSPVMNAWVVTRHEDLKVVMKNTEVFSSAGSFSFGSLVSPEALRVLGGLDHPIYAYSLVNVDPPNHTRFRNTFQRAFTPRQVSILEPQIRELIQVLLEDLRNNKKVEIIKGFCDQLPLLTICRLMGVPDADAANIKRWSTDYIRAQIPGWSTQEQQVIGQNTLDFYNFMLEKVKFFEQNPAENLISTVIEARETVDEPLSNEEIAGLTCNLITAGHETTAALIGNTLNSVLKQRELWDYFCKHPERSVAAVDEFARHDGPAVGLYRRTTANVALGEVIIPKDSTVWITYLAGNNDPDQFPNPEKLDFSRQNAASNLTFGHGIHFCIGAPLAKLELRLVLEELARVYPSLQLEPNQTLKPVPNFLLRSFQEMILLID